MSTKTFQQIANQQSEQAAWERLDWGNRAIVADELSALRIAYIHRNYKHGVQVKALPSGEFSVTLFSEDCPSSIDRS